VALFLQNHKFDVREDGTVIVVGEYFSDDAERAAVRFVDSKVGAPFKADEPTMLVKSALRQLH